MNLTKPYLITPIVLITNTNMPFVSTLKEFHGKKVVAGKGHVTVQWIKNDFPDILLIPSENYEEGLRLVSEEKAHAYAGAMGTLTWQIKKHRITNLKIAAKTDYEYRLSIAVRKDWPQLIPVLNKAIALIKKERRDTIYSKWATIRFEQGIDWIFFWKIVGSVITLSIIIFLIIFNWNRKLQHEIKQKEKAEKALKENEDKLRDILEYSTNLFYSHTADNKITYISPQCKEFLQCDPEEAMFRWTEFAPDSLINKKGFELKKKAIATGKRQEPYEQELVGKRGKKTIVEVREAPVIKNGKTLVIVGSLTDITERKQAEAHQRFQAQIINQIHDSVIAVDMNGIITSWNMGSEKLFYYPESEIIGKNISILYPKYFQAHLQDNIIPTLLHQGNHEYETTLLRKGGKEFSAIVSLSILKDDIGNIIGLIGYTLDITEQKKLQVSLKKSEFYLKQAQSVAGVGSWHLDLQNDLLSWSDQTYNMFGVEKGTPLSVSYFLELVAPDDRQLVESSWQAAMTGAPYDIEHRIIINGETLWVHEKALVTFNSKGVPLESIGTVHDITERKQAEEKIRRASEDWERTFNSVSDLIAILDDQFQIVRANKAMADKLGITPTEAVGATCYECIHGQDEPLLNCPHKQLLADGKEHRTEVFEERLGGDFLVSVTPLFDSTGQLFGSVHIAHDITERKRAETAIRESEEKFKAIFDQAAVGVSLTSTQTGAILQANSKYCDIVGYREEDLEKMTFQEISHPDDLQVDLDKMQQLREGKIKDFAIEKRFLHKDGSVIWVNLTLSPMWKAEEQLTQHITVIEDITERKIIEAKVKTLSGLLPICASCKKIRDDKGYWNQIESYVSEHSSAEFSHGLCPACSDELYGDQDWYNKKKKKKDK